MNVGVPIAANDIAVGWVTTVSGSSSNGFGLNTVAYTTRSSSSSGKRCNRVRGSTGGGEVSNRGSDPSLVADATAAASVTEAAGVVLDIVIVG
jgi:hypothetical protein